MYYIELTYLNFISLLKLFLDYLNNYEVPAYSGISEVLRPKWYKWLRNNLSYKGQSIYNKAYSPFVFNIIHV